MRVETEAAGRCKTLGAAGLRHGLRRAALLLLPALAACTEPTIQASDPLPGVGDAFNQNAAVMIIDPQPVRARDTSLPLDGHHAENAIIRYYTGSVIQPQSLSTSGIGPVPGSGQTGVATSSTTTPMQ